VEPAYDRGGAAAPLAGKFFKITTVIICIFRRKKLKKYIFTKKNFKIRPPKKILIFTPNKPNV
jgi:hypothetical protein